MIHGSDFEPDFSSAVLIEKDVVDSLNSTIRNLGDAKIQHMTNRMDYRKGIHMLEWEHKRLDMEVRSFGFVGTMHLYLCIYFRQRTLFKKLKMCRCFG